MTKFVMKFVFMLIDGTIIEINAETKQSAIQQLDADFSDINYIEWVEGGKRYLQNVVTNTLERNSDIQYFLPTLKFNATDSIPSEMLEEFDIIY